MYKRQPHEGCSAEVRTEDFASLLRPCEFERLVERAKRFAPSNLSVTCPGCNMTSPFSREVLKNVPPGAVILRCPNLTCTDRLFCYHCLRPVVPGQACEACIFGAPKGMGEFNRHFRRAAPPQPGQTVLPRNNELTPELCAQQLQEICAGDTLEAKCRGCFASLHKSSQCNELRHCGVAVCYHCGASGSEDEPVLIDHWDSRGHRGCPRYDDDRFWKNMGLCTLCGGQECGDTEHGDCTIPTHVERKRRQDYVRKMVHIDAALESLPLSLRQAAFEAVTDPNAKAMIVAARGGVPDMQ